MIRVAGLLFLVALISFGQARATSGKVDASIGVTPAATPLTGSPFDVPDAVPLSLLIQNDGADDRLLGGSTSVAARVDAHHTRLIDGRRVMETAPNGIAIPAGETLILEPGGSHLMLEGLRVDLVQGETFPLTLRFAHAGEVTVTVRVRRRVDAAGVTPVPPVVAGDLSVWLASAPPTPAGTLTPQPNP